MSANFASPRRIVFRRLREHVRLDGPAVTNAEAADPARTCDFARRGASGFTSSVGLAIRLRTISYRDQACRDACRSQPWHRATDLLVSAMTPFCCCRMDATVRKDLTPGSRSSGTTTWASSRFEFSVCGAAPPFGPLRVGKLMAGLAGADAVVGRGGVDRPLGQIASQVYGRMSATPCRIPGPVVIFTSGLFPGPQRAVQPGDLRDASLAEDRGHDRLRQLSCCR